MDFSGLIEGFDERPNVRGKQFERLCRWFLLNAPARVPRQLPRGLGESPTSEFLPARPHG